MRGREAIRAYWQREVADHQEGVSFGWDVVHADLEPAVVRWRASYTRKRDRRRFELDGVFLLAFDAGSGLCRTLVEWWHSKESPALER
jgi:SnoaL-like domain